MSPTQSHDDIATAVIDKLKKENGFRGCPLTREQQATVADLANTTRKAKKWSGVLFTALILMFAKDIYGFIVSAWQAVTR